MSQDEKIDRSPEQERIEIPKEVMDELQKNAAMRQDRYLGEAEIWDLLLKFYSTSVRFYLKQELQEWETAAWDKVEPGIITENIVHNEYPYKLAFHMNWVWAKQFAKLVKWFSVTPFNI